MPSFKHFLNIDKLLRNANASHWERVKNPATALHSESTKPDKIFDEAMTIKKQKT